MYILSFNDIFSNFEVSVTVSLENDGSSIVIKQPLDVILSQDHKQIVALLEYVRYSFLPEIQLCSIKVLSILSSRMVGLVQLLLKLNAAKGLVEDFANCLESRFDEFQVIENTKGDTGVLILQLLLDNVSRPAPNITHLLLKYDVDSSVERTILQPKVHYSCLKVILDKLEKLLKPEINYLLYEFAFQLFYELCLDPLTSGPTMDFLSTKKYHFFVQHLEGFCFGPLPKRSNNQAFRISTLHQKKPLPSPSPSPIYNDLRMRVNTRDFRLRRKLSDRRQKIISHLIQTDPTFEAPPEYKPQKMYRKLYIPVKEYPCYNFIGLIIGPHGCTHKRLEKETEARIILRGKGSCKLDRAKKY
ncbi:nuclear pore complex protein NUP205 isoform X1 [Iris pallida]|uniref:Nuclear pore complex protein NUP205 isoform X1 n=2 Tax=Iris pallida TaxID=29817 RepID=A0AAX6FBP8_IRIPA|nr:nuclear pore complex protein NUP205 isoform X1 [Iris pallida]